MPAERENNDFDDQGFRVYLLGCVDCEALLVRPTATEMERT